MPYTGAKKSLTLIVSQLEAASTLIKFAASDLGDLSNRAGAPLPEELRLIGENLHNTAGVIEGNVAFFLRLAEETRARNAPARVRRRKVSGNP